MSDDQVDRLPIGTAEREEPIFADLPVKPGHAAEPESTRDWGAIVMALVPLVALAFTMLVPHGWLAWLALPVVGMLLYGRRR